MRGELHHHVTAYIGDPDIVLAINVQPMDPMAPLHRNRRTLPQVVVDRRQDRIVANRADQLP